MTRHCFVNRLCPTLNIERVQTSLIYHRRLQEAVTRRNNSSIESPCREFAKSQWPYPTVSHSFQLRSNSLTVHQHPVQMSDQVIHELEFLDMQHKNALFVI